MTKYTLLGLLACLGGGVLIGFQAVSGAMGSKGTWQSLSLKDVLGGPYVEWMGNSSFGGAERITEYILTLPLFILLFCIGLLFFVLDYFLGRR